MFVLPIPVLVEHPLCSFCHQAHVINRDEFVQEVPDFGFRSHPARHIHAESEHPLF